MGQEVLGLGGTGARVREGKVVAATDETGIGCALVVAGEGAVDVGCTLGGLVVPFRYRNEDLMWDPCLALTLIMTKRAPEP